MNQFIVLSLQYEGAISLNDENPELQLERYACLNILIQSHLSDIQNAQTAFDKVGYQIIVF